jgi:hypothetical protein
MEKFNLKIGNIGFLQEMELEFWMVEEVKEKASPKLKKNSIIFHTLQKNSIKFKCLPNERQFKKFNDFSMCVIFTVSHRILIFIQIYDFPYENKLFYDVFNFPSNENNLWGKLSLKARWGKFNFFNGILRSFYYKSFNGNFHHKSNTIFEFFPKIPNLFYRPNKLHGNQKSHRKTNFWIIFTELCFKCERG